MRIANRIKRLLAPSKRDRLPFTDVVADETTFYSRYIQQGMLVLDVGAHYGHTTALFSRLVGKSGLVHAIEPVSETFDTMKATLSSMRIGNAVTHKLAVGNETGTVRLYNYGVEASSLNSTIDRPFHQYGLDYKVKSTEKVEMVTLDSFCAERNITRIDLLKLDIEGAEIPALRGARELLRKNQIHCCVFEFGQTLLDAGYEVDDLANELKKAGYLVRNVAPDQSVFPVSTDDNTAQYAMHVAFPKGRYPKLRRSLKL